jgi:mRNA-degrading endonuclease RelE of RelBE toxin-antitoxin system
MTVNSEWIVTLSPGAERDLKKLKKNIQHLVGTLTQDLALHGYVLHKWPNYGKMAKCSKVKKDSYHCHLQKGRPTYVAVWRVVNKESKEIEVYYVGTHEGAPY